jgi:hypothetical protein
MDCQIYGWSGVLGMRWSGVNSWTLAINFNHRGLFPLFAFAYTVTR